MFTSLMMFSQAEAICRDCWAGLRQGFPESAIIKRLPRVSDAHRDDRRAVETKPDNCFVKVIFQ